MFPMAPMVDGGTRNSYIELMTSARIDQLARKMAIEEVDELVLAAVNAPYKRAIGAATLADRLAKAEPGKWPVHVATFFTDVSPDLVLAFAAAHGLSRSELACAYLATKRKTGERNAELEAELGSVATAAS
jgi:hypothetical protein